MNKRSLTLPITLTLRGYENAIAPKPYLLPELWLVKCKAWLFLYFLDSKQLVTAWAKHLSATERSS